MNSARAKITAELADELQNSKLRGVAIIHDGKKYSVVTSGTAHEVGQLLIILVKRLATDIAENFGEKEFKKFSAGMGDMIRYDAMKGLIDSDEWRGVGLWVTDTN